MDVCACVCVYALACARVSERTCARERYTYAESLDWVRPKLGTLIRGKSLFRIS